MINFIFLAARYANGSKSPLALASTGLSQPSYAVSHNSQQFYLGKKRIIQRWRARLFPRGNGLRSIAAGAPSIATLSLCGTVAGSTLVRQRPCFSSSNTHMGPCGDSKATLHHISSLRSELRVFVTFYQNII